MRRRYRKGERRVTVRQVHRADRALFKWLRREVGASLRPDATTGIYPIDAKLLEVLIGNVPRITRMLDPKEVRDDEPLARVPGGGGSSNKRAAPGDDQPLDNKELLRLRNRLENSEAEKANLKRKLASASGAGPGRRSPPLLSLRIGMSVTGRMAEAHQRAWAKVSTARGEKLRTKIGVPVRGREFPMPPELRGPNTVSHCGDDRMCYGYNRGLCHACAPGESCASGLHVCCVKDCFSTRHGLKGHNWRR